MAQGTICPFVCVFVDAIPLSRILGYYYVQRLLTQTPETYHKPCASIRLCPGRNLRQELLRSRQTDSFSSGSSASRRSLLTQVRIGVDGGLVHSDKGAGVCEY